MAKLEKYRQYIQKLLMQHGSNEPYVEGVEVQLIFAPIRDHYQILDIG